MSLDLYLVAYADTGAKEPARIEVWHGNQTHNLTKMAHAADLYTVLWRPEERDPPIRFAYQAIPLLKAGIDAMQTTPKRFEALNPENGWGSYGGLLGFAESFLKACEEHPLAKIEVSR